MSEFTKKLLAGVATTGVCLSMFSGMAYAEEDKPTADLTFGAYSQYIWRGFELSKDSLVIQPSMTVAYKGFSANLWGNLDTDQYSDTTDGTNNWNETDMTLAYGWEMGPAAFSVGYIYYALDGVDDSQEVFVSAALNTLLTPTLTVYREIDSYQGWYTTLGISHSFPVQGDITLDLGAQASYLSADEASTFADANGDSYSNFHDGMLSVGVTVPVSTYITINPKLSYTFALSNDAQDLMQASSKNGNDDNFIYGGVSVSMAF
ncbi:MAG: hypothetical protein KJ900_11795 [Proteobacteria bacterium]|jgi:hypothetical protein|nr:hypothetical protein [Desulfocapsa sp.]MBU3943250.1 hypothetical protein [Pseudomonadota bacterium]MCG2743349.1 hypothetical protein [Desulfobacteraceae bacterium]MBU3982457.1 hypothetical protein [Pseudomonadota bacterium]MBU4027886.1 hypothetical protein [Pseudomonadota bacterium]